jgi:hypothetical protein
MTIALLSVSLAVVALLQSSGAYPTEVTNADLRLVATAPSRILVGDFLAVRTTWTARQRITEPVEYGLVEIDRGAGFQPHVEGLNGWTCPVSSRQLRPGQSLVTEHVVGLAARDAPVRLSAVEGMHTSVALAFDRPGLYRVKVRYDAAESNVLVVEVAAPADEGARLLEALRLRPAILSSYGVVDESLRAEGLELVRTYGRHRLLKPFLDRYEGRGADPVRRVDRIRD